MRIYVAGINGMVGSSIALEAREQGHEVIGKSSRELDEITTLHNINKTQVSDEICKYYSKYICGSHIPILKNIKESREIV